MLLDTVKINTIEKIITELSGVELSAKDLFLFLLL